jgi:EAL domain-containing protein (putative c-di-GMP-specific phosphodiesterase class I)
MSDCRMSNAESVRDILTWLNQHEFHRPLASSAAEETENPFYIAGDAVHATFANLQMATLFQPIVRGSSVIAHEALLTLATENTPFRPWQADDLPGKRPGSDDAQEIVYFDRLARTLHTLNFLTQDVSGDLHLNVDAHHLLAVTGNHGQVFEQIIRQCGLSPERFVLEIPEHAIRDKDHLHEAIAAWQSRHYRIAIDGFGRQHAQLARVLGLRPDIVKIDRNFWQPQLVTVAGQSKLSAILERIIDRGIAVIFTGVDTETLPAAIAPLVAAQGNRFGSAEPECHRTRSVSTGSYSNEGDRQRLVRRA